MTADSKRPTGPPQSAGVLARYAQAYARELGVAEGRVRAWVAYMILAGVLERASAADAPRFIVKGGVALEHNLLLSERRAQAVVRALVTQYRIEASRLLAKGVGPFAPVASNSTDDGRSRNRRVELVER